jgi:site-specific DNA recombinase
MFRTKRQEAQSADRIVLACYTRVSTDEQVDNESLTTQAKNCRSFAERRGMIISDEHILREDESGMKLDRPQLNRLREWIRAGKINGLILNTSDRLSRKPSHGEILLDELAHYGVRLFIVYHGRELDVREGSPDRDLLLQEMIFNRRWRYMLLEAMKRGKRGKAERGSIVTGGWTKYGFIKKQAGDIFVLETHDEQAAVIQNIFTWFVHEHIGARKVQRMLSGIPNPGMSNRTREAIAEGVATTVNGAWEQFTVS